MPLFLPGPGPLLLEKLPEADTSTPPPPTGPPPYTAGRNRSFFIVRGHQRQPVPAQVNPPYPWPTRVDSGRSKFMMMLRRGRGPLPVQPQIPVPPTIPPKLG